MNKSIFQRRRQNLINQIGENDIVIIPTAPVKQRNSDVDYQFRADSDFYYLTGFEEPEAVAVICPAREQQFVLFCREKNPEREQWDGRRAGLQGAVDEYGADDAFPYDDIADILPGMMEQRDKVYINTGRYPKFDRTILSWVNDIKQSAGRSGKHAPYELVDLSHLLHELRLFKSNDEVSLMKKAAKLTVQGHIRAMQVCKPGMYEYQVQAYMENEFRQGGSNYNAYPSIVAGGANSCILHYVENNAVLSDGDLLLIDAGAEYQNYAADVSRTFPINGKFSGEQKALYEIVLASQIAAFEKSQPANGWNEPHEAAVSVIAQGLIDEGLLKGSLQEVLEKQSYTPFYMHRTGHWLGLDVHDVGEYRVQGEWRDLEPGMVFTVEPGIYVNAQTDVDERWHNIGIRVEDDVLIRKNGHDVLTDGVPKMVDEIEALMAG